MTSSYKYKRHVYIRFVINENDEKSGRKMGLFHAMDLLHDTNALLARHCVLSESWDVRVPNPATTQRIVSPGRPASASTPHKSRSVKATSLT